MPASGEANDALALQRRQIEQIVRDGALDLGDLQVQGAVLTVLKKGLGVSGLVVRQPTIDWSSDGTGVIVSGSADFFGDSASEICAQFSPGPTGTFLELSVVLTESIRWDAEHFPLELRVTAFDLASEPGVNFALTVWAQIGEKDQPIPVVLSLPGRDGDWVFEAQPGSVPITLSRLASLLTLGSFAGRFPWPLDAVGLAELSIAYKPGEGFTSISFAVATTGGHPLIGLAKLEQLLARVSIRDLSTAKVVDLYLAGLLVLGESKLMLEAWRQGDATENARWTFKGTLSDVILRQLVTDVHATFGMPNIELPDMLRSLDFREVSIEISPEAGTFEFNAEIERDWPLLQGDSGFHLNRAKFRLSRSMIDDKASYPFSIDVWGCDADNGKPLVPGVHAKNLHVTFSHDGETWTGAGEMGLDLFEAKDIQLAASYSCSEHSSALNLSMSHTDVNDEKAPRFEVLGFTGEFGLKVENIWIAFARSVATGDTEATTTFSFLADARLTVPKCADLRGHLAFGKLGPLPTNLSEADSDAAKSHEKTGVEFLLLAQEPIVISMPSFLLDDPGHPPRLSIRKAWMSFAKEAEGSWTLDGTVKGFLESFPPRIQAALPKEDFEGKISVNSREIQVSVSEVIGDIQIDLPPLPVTGAKFDSLQVNALRPTLTISRDGDVAFSIDPTIQLPGNFNRLLFGEKDGKEKDHLFVTDRAVAAHLSLGLIGGTLGASFEFIDSPFVAFQVETGPPPERNKYWPCQLGAAGTINIGVPVFNAGATGSFEFTCWFEEDSKDPLCLPLTPIKALLGDHLGGISKVLPDKIPLLRDRTALFDEKTGVLLTHELIVGIEAIGKQADKNFALPGELREVIEGFGKVASDLPDRLKEYLAASPPKKFRFHVAADASGSLTVELSTGASREPGESEFRPLRVLFPSLPNLLGLTIYNLSFGPVLGGALFLLKLDADIDIFDPAAIGGAILAKEIGAMRKLLPDGEKTRQTIVINDLTTFIVYEAVVPIPVPLSFKELGIHMVRPSGLALEASVSFDPLANGLTQIFTTIEDLYNFGKDPNARLPTSGALDLKAQIGKTYLRLPALLGSKTFGAADAPLVDVDLYELFANVLNGIKFFSLADFLQGIPLENRSGSIDLKFGPFEFTMDWAATSRKEFDAGLKWRARASGTGLCDLSNQDRAAILALIPEPPPNTDGVVLVLTGKSGVKDLFEVEGRFGLMTARRSGFESGVSLYANFINEISFELSGSAFVFFQDDETGGAFPPKGIIGRAKLVVGDHTILEAIAEVTDDKVSFFGKADLFPNLPALTLAGELNVLITGEEFHADGRALVSLFGVVSSETGFTLSDRKFYLKTNLALLDRSAVLNLEVTASTLNQSSHGEIAVKGDFETDFTIALIAEAVKQAEGALRDNVNKNLWWAMAGLKRDLLKFPWNQEHFIPVWEAYILGYGALAIPLNTYHTINSSVDWAVSKALALLPGPVAQGIRYLRDGYRPLFDSTLKIDVAGKLDASLLRGDAMLTVSGNYAGQHFGPISFVANLNVQNLATTIAGTIVKKVIGH